MRYGLRLDLGLTPGGKIGAKAVNARQRSSRLSPEMSNEVGRRNGEDRPLRKLAHEFWPQASISRLPASGAWQPRLGHVMQRDSLRPLLVCDRFGAEGARGREVAQRCGPPWHLELLSGAACPKSPSRVGCPRHGLPMGPKHQAVEKPLDRRDGVSESKPPPRFSSPCVTFPRSS